jgi:xanthine dehydrogenase accessory factor
MTDADPQLALEAALSAGDVAVVVTAVAVEGHPLPRESARLVTAHGEIVGGTLGDPEVDRAAAGVAAELGRGGQAPAALRRRLAFGADQQRVLELHAQRLEPAPAVLIAGDNPLATAIAALTTSVGRRVIPITEDTWLRQELPRRGDAVVICDYGMPGAAGMLRAALDSDAFFVGVAVHRRSAPALVGELRSGGVPSPRLARLHIPCGLDIGAQTPAESAISIVAEITACERGRPGSTSLRSDWSWPTAAG